MTKEILKLKNNKTKEIANYIKRQFIKNVIEFEIYKNDKLTFNAEILIYIMGNINEIYYRNSQGDSNEYIFNFTSRLFKVIILINLYMKGLGMDLR